MGISIGITGGIGSGKSIVTKILNTMGYPVFYSDLEAKKIMLSDSVVKEKIIAIFGQEAYTNEELNRSFIANQIFNQPDLKNKLNQIVHPRVRESFKKLVNAHKNQFVFNEAAILFETGAYKTFDYTICVTADEKTRVERIKKRDGLSTEEIKSRMNNQWPDDKKTALANFLISNKEGVRILPQVFEIIQKLEKERKKKSLS